MFSRAPETRTPLNPLHVGERFVVLKTGADYKCQRGFQNNQSTRARRGFLSHRHLDNCVRAVAPG